jgi:hypothetical protein
MFQFTRFQKASTNFAFHFCNPGNKHVPRHPVPGWLNDIREKSTYYAFLSALSSDVALAAIG